MLILSNQDGVVDMTAAAIARTTGIPLEIITAGIKILEQPDSMSRSKEMGGQRIARLDPSRDWGWFIVNHEAYKRRISREDKLEADRRRIAGERAARRQSLAAAETSRSVAKSRDTSQGVADVAHADLDVDPDLEANSVGKPEQSKSGEEARAAAKRACALMEEAGCKQTNSTLPELLAALEEGVTPEELAATAHEGVTTGKTNPFKWAIATARSRRARGPSPVARDTFTREGGSEQTSTGDAVDAASYASQLARRTARFGTNDAREL